MSAVGHYLEEEGIPTASISLVREHSEAMRPPRALWVPFMLGRPLGAPDAPAFQKDVLRALLDLFEADGGPVVLRDFPHEAPPTPDHPEEVEGMACPLALDQPKPDPATHAGRIQALRLEIEQLRPWHDLAVGRRRGSAVGLSGGSVEGAAAALCDALAGLSEDPTPDAAGVDALKLKLACDDLRAYYEEAASAQPGGLDSDGVLGWFYGRTVVGTLLQQLRVQAMNSADPVLRAVGTSVLVPRAIFHR